MTQFLPVHLLQQKSLPDVGGPAFFSAHKRPDVKMLVVGGDAALAVFVGDERRGSCFPKKNGDNYSGLAFEGGEIYIDLQSEFNPMKDGAPVTSLALANEALYIFADLSDRFGNREIEAINIKTGECERYLEAFAGFTRWKIVMPIGDEKIDLHTVDVTPQSNRNTAS